MVEANDTEVIQDKALVDLTTWKDRVEVGSKIGILGVSIAYAVGLIVLNIHVRQYGLNYLNFLQLEYILVGFLWILLVGATYFVSLFLVSTVRRVYNKEHKAYGRIPKRIIKIGAIVFAVVSLYFAFTNLFFALLSDSTLIGITPTGLIAVGVVALNAFASYAVVDSIRSITRLRLASHSDPEVGQEKRHDLGYGFFREIALVLVVLSLYSIYVFPYLLPEYGGGKSQRAEFILKDDGRETARALGFVFLPESRNIGPQEVIFEATDFFLLAPPPGHGDNVKAIRIRKDMVDAVFYVSGKKPK